MEERKVVAIAVVAMGEMGSGIAARLAQSGAHVMTSVAGRSAASADRARAAGVVILSDQELVAQADIFLSIVPPAVAAETADRFRALIEVQAHKPVFIDCNAIAPQTLHAMARPFEEKGLRFGDASILGLPPREGYSPRVYMSGDVAGEAVILERLGLETRLLSPQLGDASGIKMAYAGITKGIQAIATSMAIGASRAGAGEAFVAELQDTQPQLYAWFQKMLPSMPAKAYRFDDEMEQIATFLEPEQGAAEMLRGAAKLYRHVAEDQRSDPDGGIPLVVKQFLNPKA